MNSIIILLVFVLFAVSVEGFYRQQPGHSFRSRVPFAKLGSDVIAARAAVFAAEEAALTVEERAEAVRAWNEFILDPLFDPTYNDETPYMVDYPTQYDSYNSAEV